MIDLKNNVGSNDLIEPAPGVLYIVGTPIGHLGDLSPRAQSLLTNVSAIACEDTRHSRKLISKFRTKALLISFHRHNAQSRLPTLLELLKTGKSLALISDAGLPGISDPGEELVSATREAGLQVICIPGPCAATTALVCSGLPSGRFCFEGFLPPKGSKRAKLLKEISQEERTTVLYESPHRLIQLLKELITICGAKRSLYVARELTKRHEQHIGPTIGIALKYFLENEPIGECTIILGGAEKKLNIEISEPELLKKMHALIDEGLSTNESARLISKEEGLSKRFLYRLLHQKDIS